jgi:hypothetical protein
MYFKLENISGFFFFFVATYFHEFPLSGTVIVYDLFQLRDITNSWNNQSVPFSKILCRIINFKLSHLPQPLYMSCNFWTERINLNK